MLKSPVSEAIYMGHAAPILYAAWAEAGLFPVDDLLHLRKIDSDLEGHPTPRLSFVDIATGSLGQGLSCAAGMAYVGKYIDKANYRVYCIVGDGESAEGSVWEALSFISHYKLDNLVVIFDVNRLGQSEPTPLQHSADVYKARLEAFLDIENKEGWHGKPLGTQGTEIIKQIQEELLKKGTDTKLERTAPDEEIEAIDYSDMKLSEEPSYVFSEKKQDYSFRQYLRHIFTRAMDQLRMAAISQANIKCCGSHCGVSIGEDGPSQMGLEDIALFRTIPGSTIFYPSDAVSTERAVELSANTKKEFLLHKNLKARNSNHLRKH
ncbi:transketolase [Caerostris extrusa]|uniref:Transketolase n=1 Tax=Caerostris extrusa TaxID=172846 RepID=A0AAV4M643_CAEEX|nr:transketolase [Caerostris extrusa]